MIDKLLLSGLCHSDSTLVVYFNSKSAYDKLLFACKLVGLLSSGSDCKADMLCISANGDVSSLFSVDSLSDSEDESYE